MIITEVKIRLIKGSSRLKAIASIIIDGDLAINDLKIIHAKRWFVCFPQNDYAAKANLQFVVPLNRETRDMIEKVVLDKYKKMLQK